MSKQPFLCPKCEGEREVIQDCAVCDGSGVIWGSESGDTVVVKKKIIIEEEVIRRRRYVPDYWPYRPYPYIWNVINTRTTGEQLWQNPNSISAVPADTEIIGYPSGSTGMSIAPRSMSASEPQI